MTDTLSPATELALFRLTSLLQPARRAWTQAAGQALGDFDLSVPLALVLILLSRNGGAMRQSELAELVGVGAGAMVRTLDQAEAAGFVERRGVAGDRRANLVHALPEGAALAGRMEAAMTRLRNALLGDLPADDVAAAVRVLGAIEERCGRQPARDRDGA